MNLFLVTGFPTIVTPLWSVMNPADSNGLAQKMVPEMIWMTPEMVTMLQPCPTLGLI